MPVTLEETRREWREGNRRFEAELRDPEWAHALSEELETIIADLRRRVGQTFTLAELVDEYASADNWSREAVASGAPSPGWPRRLTLVTDAAFYLYSRGAVDYEP